MIPDAVDNHANAVNAIRHAALTGGDSVRAFQSWIDEAMRQLVLGGNGQWTLQYVRSASDVAIQRANKFAAQPVSDADFDEDRHPRDKDGKFTESEENPNHAEALIATAHHADMVEKYGGQRTLLAREFFNRHQEAGQAYARAAEGYEKGDPRADELLNHARKMARQARGLRDADFDESEHPRDDKGMFTASQAVERLNALPEVTGSGRHFDPSFGGEDYGPEVTVRSAGFERTSSPTSRRPNEKFTVERVPLDQIIVHQSAVTKGLVEKYINDPPSERVDVVHSGGKYYAASGTHRLVAAKMRGMRTIEANVIRRKDKIKDAAPPQDRIPPLQTLAIVELQGIVEAVSQQAVRAYAEGTLTKQSASAIARSIQQTIDQIGKKRSDLLVSFIVVRAFGAATLDQFRASGITHVGTVAERTGSSATSPSLDGLVRDAKKIKTKNLVEVLTAGDDRVCPQCEDISEEGPYTLDEAESLIPAHPRCRCAFVPWDDARFAHDADEFAADEFNSNQPRDPKGKWATGGHWLSGKTSSTKKSMPHPSGMHGVPFESWTPPATDGEWAAVEGQNHDIAEPPLPELKTYSYTDAKGKTKTWSDRLSSGVVVAEPDGRTWLTKPANGFGGYQHSFPKGGVEPGLSPQANAIKEAYEETGLKVAITGFVGDFRGDTGYTRMYRAVRTGGHPADHSWESEAVLLAHPKDLDKLLNRTRDKRIAGLITDEFEEAKHPRDKDGKFAHKGESGFDPEYDPDDDYAVLPKPGEPTGNPDGSVVPIEMGYMTKVSGKKGSNEGGVYETGDGLHQYYIKTPKTMDHVQNELTAAKLYQLAGVNTMKYVPVMGGAHVATELVPLDKSNVKFFNAAEREKAQSDFAIHAWLANHDAVGTGGDNQVTVNGIVSTVDTGGSLKYRAQGEPKGALFGDKVNETVTMRGLDPNVHAPDAAALYGPMTDSQIKQSIARVTSIPDSEIHAVVKANMPHATIGEQSALASKLILRKYDLAEQAAKLTGAAPLPLPTPAVAAAAAVVAPAHPAAAHLKSVKGTSAERVAWRKELDATSFTQPEAKKALQEKIVASFWKQHDKAFGDKKDELAKKLNQYAKKYGMKNPLLAAPPVAVAAPSAALAAAKVFAPAASISAGPATTADLEKAKLTTELKSKYVPGAPVGHPEAEKLVAKFNEKYAGKTLTTQAELEQKVADFKKMQAAMVPLQSEAQKVAAATAAAQAVAAAEHQAKLAVAAKEKFEAEAAAEAAKLADPEYKKMVEKAKADEEVLKSVGINKYEMDYATKTIAKHKLSITPAEGAAIRAYVGSHYDGLNEDLRRGVKMSVSRVKYAMVLDKAMEKMPIYEGYVQRGIKHDKGFQVWQHYADNVGHVVTEHQFNSSGVTHKLWGETTLHITSKTGRDIRSFNNSEGGGEIVFRPGVKWHVIKANKNTREIWIEELF